MRVLGSATARTAQCAAGLGPQVVLQFWHKLQYNAVNSTQAGSFYVHQVVLLFASEAAVHLLCTLHGCAHMCRVVDPESDGKLANSAHNLEVQGLKDYLCDRGRGYAGFRQPSAVLVLQ